MTYDEAVNLLAEKSDLIRRWSEKHGSTHYIMDFRINKKTSFIVHRIESNEGYRFFACYGPISNSPDFKDQLASIGINKD